MTEQTPMPRARFRITGRVQGVGFRWWTLQQAGALGLAGTVRNCRDGSVEVEVAGPAEAVASLRRRLAVGPAGARVANVETLPPGERRLPGDFRIEH